jgi:hypothetical protein
MPKLCQELRHIEMMGQEQEGEIVSNWATVAVVGEVDARTPAVNDQSRRVGD